VRPFRPNITLFGGEPFLHPNIVEIIAHVKDIGLHCLVITNGTLLAQFAGELVDKGLDELNISIDGGRDLHDKIRGLPGIFDQVMGGIQKINDWKKQRSKSRPLINLQCTITQYNYERLDELIGVARRAQANSLTFHNLIFLSKNLIEKQKAFDQKFGCSSKDWEGFVFEAGIDPFKLYCKMKDILSKHYEFAVDFFPNFSQKGLAEYYGNSDYLPSEYAPRCISPWVCAYIFPEGEVRPCLNCSFSFGNVKRASFLNIWNSDKAIFYRKALRKEGIFPVCRRCTELYRY
jgi:MoaA/NifB/PqqE/SkfB family radical SAM enzyme